MKKLADYCKVKNFFPKDMMMNTLKEYAEVVRETRKFAKKELADNVLEWDLNPDPEKMLHVWRQSYALDLPLLSIPEEFNGVGYGPLCQAFAIESLAEYCPGVASVIAHHFAGLHPVLSASRDQQKELYRAVATGEGRGISGVIFDHEGALSLEKNNQGYVLNGKSSLSANTAYADWMSVFVRNEDQGTICLAVDMQNPGVSIGPNPALPGLKINPFRSVEFKDAIIPPQAVFGNSGKADDIMKQTRDLLFVLTAAMSVGAARNAFDKALAYAGERYQFGMIIIKHQEIRRMLGNMHMKLSAANAFLYDYLEENFGLMPPLKKDASLVKAFCTDSAFDIVVDAIQIHGGYGYMHEQGLEKLMRDVKVLQVLGGSNPQLLVDFISINS